MSGKLGPEGTGVKEVECYWNETLKAHVRNDWNGQIEKKKK